MAAGSLRSLGKTIMSAFKSDFLRILSERGFIHQISDAEGLDAAVREGQTVTAYIGFDCDGDEPAYRQSHLRS